jgi:hypothetical protein
MPNKDNSVSPSQSKIYESTNENKINFNENIISKNEDNKSSNKVNLTEAMKFKLRQDSNSNED